jgi:hypothetical protein
MTLLDVNLSEAKEPVAAPEGEYELTCKGPAVQKVGASSGKPYLNIRFEFVDPPSDNTDAIYHIASLPAEEDSPSDANKKLLRLKKMCDALGVDYSDGIDLESFAGTSVFAIVGVDSDAEYGDRNNIKRFIGEK